MDPHLGCQRPHVGAPRVGTRSASAPVFRARSRITWVIANGRRAMAPAARRGPEAMGVTTPIRWSWAASSPLEKAVDESIWRCAFGRPRPRAPSRGVVTVPFASGAFSCVPVEHMWAAVLRRRRARPAVFKILGLWFAASCWAPLDAESPSALFSLPRPTSSGRCACCLAGLCVHLQSSIHVRRPHFVHSLYWAPHSHSHSPSFVVCAHLCSCQYLSP